MVSSEKLMYYVDKKWEPLPKWCRFLISLGETIGGFSKDSSFIVALSLPTRAYAAAFITMGVIVARTKQIIQARHNQTYFKKLCSLPPGTPLIYTNRGKRYKAVLESIEMLDSSEAIRIMYGGSKELPEYVLITQQYADRLFQTDEQFTIPKYQKGKDIVQAKKFVERILPSKVDVVKFATTQQLECIWVGKKTLINQELKDTLAILEGNKTPIEGTLQDLVRMKHLSGSGTAFLTETVPATSKDLNCIPTEEPFAVIFDGVKGFLNCREHFPQSNWIVLLDRTEPSFDKGVYLLNHQYFNRSAELNDVINQKCPPGIEIMAFRRG